MNERQHWCETLEESRDGWFTAFCHCGEDFGAYQTEAAARKDLVRHVREMRREEMAR